MDENERNIHLVTDNTGYAGEAKSGRDALRRKVSYQKRQKERRLKKKRRRAALLFVLAAAVVCVILFMTPIFNIRSLSVEGNNIVTEAQITDKLKPLVGQNLLRTGSGSITKTLKSIPYIDTVDIQKKLFPPSVQIKVTEYAPAALLRAEGSTLVVNSSLHILSDTDVLRWQLPVITGVEVKAHNVGEDAVLSNGEKANALKTALSTISRAGLTEKIIEIDITNLTYILMNYDNRIDVKCGSSLDIDRKMLLLSEVVTSNSIADNAKGTIDLSETGKAVYTP